MSHYSTYICFIGSIWILPGWWLYVVLRFAATILLVWIIWNFPKQQGRADTAVKGERFFDPLMGIRALACLMVLMGHYFIIVFPFSTVGVSNTTQILLHSSPWAGVWLFFALSGFLMGKGFVGHRYTLDEAGYRSFMRNRVLRIAPVYVIGLFLVSLYRYTEILQWKNTWMLAEILMFDYRGDLPITSNGTLWSISTEMQFYLLAPMLILIRLHKWTGRAFIAMPVLFVCAGTLFRIWIRAHSRGQMLTYGYTPLVPNLTIFLAGMSVNLLPKMRFRRWFSLALLVSTLVFYSVICYFTFYMNMSIEDYWARMPFLVVRWPYGLFIWQT